MSEETRFRVGGISLALVPAHPGCTVEIEERFERFVTGPVGEAMVVLRAHCGPMPELDLGQPVFETGLGWRLYRTDSRWIVYVRSPEQDPYQLGVFEANYHAGDIFMNPQEMASGQTPFPLAYPLGKVFMINLLSRGHGVLMHACGVNVGGKGLLFTGTSTAGKTTTARLWAGREGASLLGDDNIIVGERDGRYWMYGTPWPGEGGVFSPEAVPLDRIFVLRHASENRAVPLRPVDAASRLLVRSFPTFWDAEGMAYTTELLGRLAQAVPCYDLGFRPEPDVVDYVRGLAQADGRSSELS